MGAALNSKAFPLEPVAQCRGSGSLHIGQLSLGPKNAEMPLDLGTKRSPMTSY